MKPTWIAAMLLLAGVAVGGYMAGVAHEAGTCSAELVAAKSGVKTAQDDARAARDALAEVQRKLDQQRDDMDRARQAAAIALDQRDAVQQQIATLTRQREAALRKTAHETPACQDLARLPICPAVAVRLFGPSDDASGGSR